MNNRKSIWLAIGLLIIMAILGTIMRRQVPPRVDLPFDMQSPMLAAEFMRNADEITAVFGVEHRYANAIQRQQYIDFVFIPSYVALFVIVGLALRYADVPGAKTLAWIAVGVSIAAGAFDIAENIAILNSASNPGIFTSKVRWFSMPKWGLVFAVMCIESLVFFFWPRLKSWRRALGIVVGAMLLFAGAAGLLFTSLSSYRDIERAANWSSYAFIAMLLFLASLVRTKVAR